MHAQSYNRFKAMESTIMKYTEYYGVLKDIEFCAFLVEEVLVLGRSGKACLGSV